MVSTTEIFDLVGKYARARQDYLADATPSDMVHDSYDGYQNYSRLRRTVDRWISLVEEDTTFSNQLLFPAMVNWVRRYKINDTEKDEFDRRRSMSIQRHLRDIESVLGEEE